MITQGKRQDIDDEHPLLQASEFGKFEGIWYAQTPNDIGVNLAGHTVNEHEDGTITVVPSIACRQYKGDMIVSTWHGYLVRGVWREV